MVKYRPTHEIDWAQLCQNRNSYIVLVMRPHYTWTEVVQRDCQVRGLSKDDAMVRGRWRKMIRVVDEQEGCEGV